MSQQQDSPPNSPARQPLLRRSEIVLVAYFLYVALVGLFLAIPPQVSQFTLTLNLLIAAGYLVLGQAGRRRPRLVLSTLSIVRDWLPVALILLAYREMGWLAPERHTYEMEGVWVVWDRMLLNDWALGRAIEFFGPLLPSVLELSYTLVYSVGPFSLGMLYFYAKRPRADQFLFPFVLGTLLAYALYPYFPSEPPRTVFPDADLPQIETVFRRLNLWILSGGGIHTSVFPSGHVAHVFSAAFAMRRVLPEKKWVGRYLLVLVVFICIGTVYGRYHYAVDGLAGIAVSLVAMGVTRAVERKGAA